MKYFIIFPIHLFQNIEVIKSIEPDQIYLIEEDKYFTSFPFHKSKLTFHRATMKYYFDYLVSKEFKCKYINSTQSNKYSWVKKDDKIYSYDPVDHGLRAFLYKLNSEIILINSPSFLESIEDLYIYQQTQTNSKKYFHDASFYKWQRKRLGILVDSQGKPEKDQWSFDKLNRKPFDSKFKPTKPSKWSNEYWDEATKYINKTFPNNFGTILDYCLFPLTFEQNKSHLKKFISNCLKTFGTYEDAVSSEIISGSHSLLSVSLNVGLITPDYILTQIIKFHKLTKGKYIQQVEAFIRQIIGWRSYVRFVYEFHGEEMINENLLGHKAKVPSGWYSSNPKTGFDFIDGLISKAWTYGYLHHIERLMYISNLFLLMQIDPKQVYKWFMICFLDSYEWVMVPNVMGMGQYSLETIQMMTRPYFSSSAYIKRMSDFKSENIRLGLEEYSWEDVWNALYYNFVSDNSILLKSIYSTAIQVKNLNNLDSKKKKDIKHIAKLYIKTYG